MGAVDEIWRQELIKRIKSRNNALAPLFEKARDWKWENNVLVFASESEYSRMMVSRNLELIRGLAVEMDVLDVRVRIDSGEEIAEKAIEKIEKPAVSSRVDLVSEIFLGEVISEGKLLFRRGKTEI